MKHNKHNNNNGGNKPWKYRVFYNEYTSFFFYIYVFFLIALLFWFLTNYGRFTSFYLSDSPSPIVDESPFVIHDDLPLQVRVSEPNFDLSEENLTILPDSNSNSDSARVHSNGLPGFYHDAPPNVVIEQVDVPAEYYTPPNVVFKQVAIPCEPSKVVTFHDAPPSEVVFRRDAPPSEVIHGQNALPFESPNVELNQSTSSCNPRSSVVSALNIIYLVSFVGILLIACITFPHFYDILSKLPPKG